ncbi:MAG: carbonic anhydrase [Mesorhizobium sp.]|nr:MAG: carbonic anhydrase [Mesorhizobium sp.]
MPHLPEHLLTGYRNFMNGRYPAESGRYRSLAREGQAPETMIVACCDSRSAPEAIFDAGPGELFVLRNVGNLVPPYEPDGEFHSTSAALEFAVQSLKERQTALERISIRYSIANLRTFPCVSILEGKGKLTLHGAWFDISTGELWLMNKETGDFERPEL